MSNLKREYVKYIKKLLKPQEPMGKYIKDNKISEFKNEEKKEQKKFNKLCLEILQIWWKTNIQIQEAQHKPKNRTTKKTTLRFSKVKLMIFKDKKKS